MSDNDVICLDEKENVLKEKKICESKTINNNNVVIVSDEEEKEDVKKGECLLSPPRKKLKQDAIPFPVVPKNVAIKELNESFEEEKESNKSTSEVEHVDIEKENPSKENTKTSKSPLTTPGPKTPSGKKLTKSPGLSKEEKEKQREEKERLKQERQRELDEKRKQKEEEKKRREEDRLQKQAEKERREQEKKLEKEKREEERKEKEKIREEERKKKDEEKKKRDEQREIEKEKKETERKQREVERDKKETERKLEEEKRKLKEEAEKKKKEKAANQFKSFFTKKTEKKSVERPIERSRFASFQLAPNMMLAPCVRRTDFNKSGFEMIYDEGKLDISTYLEELAIQIANRKTPEVVTRRKLRKDVEAKRKLENEEARSEKIVANDKELEPKTKRRKSSGLVADEKHESPVASAGAIVIDDSSNDNEYSTDEEEDENETSFVEEKRLMKVVFLKFNENTRPPYYGTWRKKTKKISGRKPFGQDTAVFNYDIDSDEEWIDEPGEDCSDNGEEEDEEDKETEDDQDGFFVPHGYLSDDEGVHCESDEEEDGDTEGNENKLPVSKEVADAKREQDKLKSKVESFEVAFKKKLKPRRPICLGIKFVNNPEELDPVLKEYIKISLFKSEKEVDSSVGVETPTMGNEHASKLDAVSPFLVKQSVPEEAMPLLLKLLHGNQSAMPKMIAEFQSYWVDYTKVNQMTDIRSSISKRQLEKKIQSVTSKSHNATLGKICYTVNLDILTRYGMTDLELGCGLVYPVPKLEMNDDAAVSESSSNLKTVENGIVVNGTTTTTNGDINFHEKAKTDSIMDNSNSKSSSQEPAEVMVID